VKVSAYLQEDISNPITGTTIEVRSGCLLLNFLTSDPGKKIIPLGLSNIPSRGCSSG
jgi:hypothetical protein